MHAGKRLCLPPYNAKAKCSVIAAIEPVFHFNRIVPKRSAGISLFPDH
jgi:hypothetical protein